MPTVDNVRINKFCGKVSTEISATMNDSKCVRLNSGQRESVKWTASAQMAPNERDNSDWLHAKTDADFAFSDSNNNMSF